ncbi:penicillin-binding protein 2, partial [bacterium]|nr:penicillin-binding protein 2 [bacterium]
FGILPFLVLLSILWYKQIIRGDKYKDLSQRNYIRLVPLRACRGTVYDRKGRVLADTEPLFQLIIIPQELRNVRETAQKLAPLIDMEEAQILRKLKRHSFNPFKAVVIKNEVDMQVVTAIEERKSHLPGVFIQVEPRRSYPFHRLASHLLGYIGRISEEERAEYQADELIGRSGIEKEFDAYLRGRNGGREVLVNFRGEQVSILGEKKPRAGNNLILTIDKELQEVAERSLRGRRGAVVAIAPENGDILALASSPGFDPNMFTKHLPPAQFEAVSKDPGRPLFNRAISGLYRPASTFKIVTASAALEKEVVEADTTLMCEGTYLRRGHPFLCWEKRGHSRINVVDALAYSCDIFFYKVGEVLGVENLSNFSRRFGLGEPTGVQLPFEDRGLVPAKGLRRRWHLGEIFNLAIGQEESLKVTPLQMANLVAAVANGGTLFRPRIIKEIRSVDGELIKAIAVRELGNLRLSHRTLAIIKKGLWSAVNKDGGTGHRARLTSVEVAGKTGTDQVVMRKFSPGEEIPYQLRDHAWFVAFAPYEKPQIALTVLIEHGESGGRVAAPIAKEILERFFQ